MITVKKIIVICLVLSMCFSNIGYNAYAEVFNKIEYSEEISVIKELGILDDAFYEDGMADTITRGEMAMLAVKFVNINAVDTMADMNLYSDVKSDNPYAGYINAATKIGFFSGEGDGKFYPQESINMHQAVKIAVTMLGYGEYAYNNGGYPTGYLTAAQKADILDNVDTGSSQPANRGNVLTLFYNALTADMMLVESIGSNREYTVKEGTNLLNKYFDIYTGEGIVNSTSLTALSGNPNKENYVTVGNKVYFCDDKTILGCIAENIEYYYKEVSGKNTILSFREKNNNAVKLSAEDIINYNTSNYTYDVSGNNKNYSLKLDRYFTALFNNCLVDGKTNVDYNQLLNPQSGSITLIDNNDDKLYDVVIIKQSVILIFSNYDQYKHTIFDLYDRSYDLNTDNYSDFYIVDSANNEISPESLKKDNVLMVYKSLDNKNAFAQLCGLTVQGEVTQKESENNKITIGNTEYEYSDNSRIENHIKVGQNYQIYTDDYGKIVYWKEISSKQTGYILAQKKKSGIENVSIAKIIDANGQILQYSFADSVSVYTINSKNTYSSANVSEKLKELAASMYSSIANPDYRMFVQYELDENKFIKSVTLPYVIKDKEDYNNPPYNYSFFKVDFIVNYGASMANRFAFKKENNSIGLFMPLSSACNIYYVPEFNNTVYSDNEYGVVPTTALEKDHRFYFTDAFSGENTQMEAYSTDRNVKIIDDIILVSSEGMNKDIVNGYDNNCLITNISKTCMKNGDEATKISIIENGQENAVYINNDDLMKKDKLKASLISSIAPTISAEKNELQKGDIIKYSLGNDGYATSIAIIYDMAASDITYKSATLTDYNVQYRYTSGKTIDEIFAERGQFGEFSVHALNPDLYVTEMYNTSAFSRVYVYDKSKDKAIIGTYNDICVGDDVFVCLNYGIPREIVVYKGENN